MTRRVELYGRLRDAGAGQAVELEVPPGASARDVLAALARRLGAGASLQGVALATDAAVLPPDAEVPAAGRLAALPPVCGG
ncbi:MAG: MoaD/ThiS family protein [Elusimicrobia bacterium]|nr:MoaD/ThiS family protein [Elusimicrobiota bacterium]